jgi:biopolymer transport protein ExbD
MGGGGGEYELNLTPYIDLMSTLIVFLLMTAVWNQIAVLSSDTGGTTASPESTPPNKTPPISLSVTILKNEMEMTENSNSVKIPHVGDQIDSMKMVEILNQWKQKYPNKTDVTLNTENAVSYKMLIKAFDTLVGNNYPDVGVSTQ